MATDGADIGDRRRRPVTAVIGPLLTLKVVRQMRRAAESAAPDLECSLDLERSMSHVEVTSLDWQYKSTRFPYPQSCKDRTIYYWNAGEFEPVCRYDTAFIKLIPTEWGPPTFEIDGIKMLPSAHVSPLADARRKVSLVQPRGKRILDTCGGLGYFACCCLTGGAGAVLSYEKSNAVLWLRTLNPWSPLLTDRLTLLHADITERIVGLADASFDAALHDPPRIGIAGELYSQRFYDHLARVLKRRGKLFHYTGTPNKLTTGRDVPNEVANRLRHAGFWVRPEGDGVFAVKVRDPGSIGA